MWICHFYSLHENLVSSDRCKKLVWYMWRWVQKGWKKVTTSAGICQWWKLRSWSKLQLRRSLLRWAEIPGLYCSFLTCRSQYFSKCFFSHSSVLLRFPDYWVQLIGSSVGWLGYWVDDNTIFIFLIISLLVISSLCVFLLDILTYSGEDWLKCLCYVLCSLFLFALSISYFT